MITIAILTGVREYAEGYPVELLWDEDIQRFIIYAKNQGGDDCVNIDLFDLIKWIKSVQWTGTEIPDNLQNYESYIRRDSKDI